MLSTDCCADIGLTLHVLSSQPGKSDVLTIIVIVKRGCICYAGVLPPCGHACNAEVLVDQGLRPLQNLHHVQLMHQQPATNNSMHVDSAPDPSPPQLPNQDSRACGLGATEQSRHHSGPTVPLQCLHQQAASRVQCASDHTQTSTDAPSNCGFMNSVHLGTSRTETVHPTSGVEAAQHTDTLYCGAGRSDAFLALSFDQLLALSNGLAVDLVQGGASQSNNSGCSGPEHRRTLHTENTFLLDSMCGRLCRWLRSAPTPPRSAGALLRCASAQIKYLPSQSVTTSLIPTFAS